MYFEYSVYALARPPIFDEKLGNGSGLEAWLGAYLRKTQSRDYPDAKHFISLCVLALRFGAYRVLLEIWIRSLGHDAIRALLADVEEFADRVQKEAYHVAYGGMCTGVTSRVLQEAHKCLHAYDDLYCLSHMMREHPEVRDRATELLVQTDRRLKDSFERMHEILYASDKRLSLAIWWDSKVWHMAEPWPDDRSL